MRALQKGGASTTNDLAGTSDNYTLNDQCVGVAGMTPGSNTSVGGLFASGMTSGGSGGIDDDKSKLCPGYKSMEPMEMLIKDDG